MEKVSDWRTKSGWMWLTAVICLHFHLLVPSTMGAPVVSLRLVLQDQLEQASDVGANLLSASIKESM